ncbi:MAG: glycoside hydrolase family 26 protein [Dyadobacter fermentans]
MIDIRYIAALAGIWLNVVTPACCQEKPVNASATTQTGMLLKSLHALAENGTMFGHQDDLVNGINWKYKKDSSDIRTMAGDYPAVFGWDIGKIEINDRANFEGVLLHEISKNVKRAHAKGGINTISWLCYNPVSPTETAKSTTDSTIRKLFADPVHLKRYNGWLDRVAAFLKNLKDDDGQRIPIVLRLFHENTGNWFWWGKKHCTPEEYIRLFRYTVDYLKDKRKVNNVLFAYCTDKFKSRDEYLERYPGDEYVDVIGADIYDGPKNHETFITDARKMVTTMTEIGREKGKPSAIMETGYRQMPVHDWFTNFLYPVIRDSGLSYVMIWKNARKNAFWGTYPGHIAADDFVEFTQKPDIMLLQKARKKDIHRSK